MLKTPSQIETPCYAVDIEALIRNASVLNTIKSRTGCKILLALKAFAMWRAFPLLNRVLDGTCASSPWEARLGREEFGGEVHAFSAAYADSAAEELFSLCDHVVFNSMQQWDYFSQLRHAKAGQVSCGIRINPEHSTQEVPLYDPCAPRSRLGVRSQDLRGMNPEQIEGLHFHTLCEQNADALESTVHAVETRFAPFLGGLRWLNLGGGHHMTRSDYDIDRLCGILTRLIDRYHVEVYLEPGEAVALNAGFLMTSVLDVIDNDGPIAILDCSCTAHMPDVLEMPYRPGVFRCDGSLMATPESRGCNAGERRHTYRLAGLSCLAGDVIGDYSFDLPLRRGDRLVFEDMAIYSMVKSTMFNGVQHPSIALYDAAANKLEITRVFGYQDFRNRLS